MGDLTFTTGDDDHDESGRAPRCGIGAGVALLAWTMTARRRGRRPQEDGR
ncbi:MAG: hypothetical protein H0W83_03585 [Planctomycetes bacterium]|nr:hypothetical protein [Planctomycetota bacterium]